MSIPKSEEELLERAQALAGLTLGEIAASANIAVPKNLKKEKGWGGMLLEKVLGASAGSKPIPDFPTLGIELKSLPISRRGKPLETTFVCVAPLIGFTGQQWQDCQLRKKMARVLWVPVIAEREIPVAERIVGTPFIWSPSPEEEFLLAQDWQLLTDMIVLGEVEQINAKHGDIMQLRPKAAHSKIRTQAFNHKGEPFMTLPRGFYLKTAFTHLLLKKHLRIE